MPRSTRLLRPSTYGLCLPSWALLALQRRGASDVNVLKVSDLPDANTRECVKTSIRVVFPWAHLVKTSKVYQDPHPKVRATERRSSYISWGHTCKKSSGMYSTTLLTGSCLSLQWAAKIFLALLRVPPKVAGLPSEPQEVDILPQGVSLTFQNLNCSCSA